MIRFEITLDKRTQKKNGKYPLKLRVTDYNKVRFVSLKVDYTEKEYDSIFFGKHPKQEFLEMRRAADGWIKKAIEIEKVLKPFNFEVFRDLLSSKKDFKLRDGIIVGDLFDDVIKRTGEFGSKNTASTYKTAKNSLLRFRPNLKIQEITPSFLREFESWHIQKRGGVLTGTVAIYLRHLRAVINEQRDNGRLPEGYVYPFGRYRYVIPEVKNLKVTLKRDEILRILTCKDFLSEEEEFARNLWAFQFYCNGINLIDLIKMKWSDQVGNSFAIRREKTKNTTRGNPQLVQIPIGDGLKKYLDLLGNRNSEYVLGFLKDSPLKSSVLNKRMKVGKDMNKHLVQLGERLGLSVKLTSEVSRDAYATSLKKSGASLDVISEMMGHTSTAVTKHYLDSFDLEHLHQVNDLLPKV